MKREIISQALNALDERHISETAVFDPKLMQSSPERSARVKTKRIITLALAAALILALGAAAYASDIFGIKTMTIDLNQQANIIPEADAPESPANKWTDISVSQPQAVEDTVDAAIKEKIENSAKAWAEWEAWRKENGIHEPAVFEPPEGAAACGWEENEDGTYTVIVYAFEETDDENELFDHKLVEMERRTATAEEYEQEMAYIEAKGKGYGEYDSHYWVYSQEMEEKLESIAASYGLKLRHKSELMLQNFDGETELYTREEIIQRVNEICAGGGSFFRTGPTGFDKFYFYDEGTFAVSFYTDDALWDGVNCYLYNSPYGTLSSGREVIDTVLGDVDSFSTRSHITPDGTELTVMQGDTDAFAYVYLENSYVALHIGAAASLTEAKVDAILDMVDFSTIG